MFLSSRAFPPSAPETHNVKLILCPAVCLLIVHHVCGLAALNIICTHDKTHKVILSSGILYNRNTFIMSEN